jgi:predicted TIM-barrel fold metal-dependent hydrolase
MIAGHKGVFCGTAVIDPAGADPAKLMTELAKKAVRAFRVYPKLTRAPIARWLQPAGYAAMFAAGAKNNQALSCLIDPAALPEIDRMCKKYPSTPVIIDHLCRIGVNGIIDDTDVQALCELAKHKRIMVKVGAFYALGKKKPPYTDLAPMIRKVVKAFGPQRCMWESDCPFQVVDGNRYADSIDLVKKHLPFLSATDRDWLLRKTAQAFFFPE